MNSWLKNYFDKWQEGDFFQSGAGLGNFNRVLYNIHWTESAPKKSYRSEENLQFPPNPRNEAQLNPIKSDEPNCENWCDCHPYCFLDSNGNPQMVEPDQPIYVEPEQPIPVKSDVPVICDSPYCFPDLNNPFASIPKMIEPDQSNPIKSDEPNCENWCDCHPYCFPSSNTVDILKLNHLLGTDRMWAPALYFDGFLHGST